jgi:hypothetical protein
MSALRTMTAAELAADTDEAREVWAKVERGELAVTRTVAQGSLHVPAHKEVVPFLQSGEQLTITVTRLGEVLAERDTLAAIVAAVEAELAKLPDGCVYASNRKLEDHYDAGYQTGKYAAKQLMKRAIAEARNEGGEK